MRALGPAGHLRCDVLDRGDQRLLGGVLAADGLAREDEARDGERQREHRSHRHQRVIGERRGALRQLVVPDPAPARGEHAPRRAHRAERATRLEAFLRPHLAKEVAESGRQGGAVRARHARERADAHGCGNPRRTGEQREQHQQPTIA